MNTDEEKLNYCENKLKKITNDFVSHKINSEEFNQSFIKYGSLVEFFRKKLNKPQLFKNDEDFEDNEDNKDEVLQLKANP